jgi:hypothetical protein
MKIIKALISVAATMLEHSYHSNPCAVQHHV